MSSRKRNTGIFLCKIQTYERLPGNVRQALFLWFLLVFFEDWKGLDQAWLFVSRSMLTFLELLL